MLSIYEVKYVLPFLDDENVSKFCLLNRNYNEYTDDYIDRKIKFDFEKEVREFKEINEFLLGNWILLKDIIFTQKKKMRIYLNYINNKNTKIKYLINYVYDNENEYEINAIIKLCELFGLKQQKDNIKIFSKYMIDRNKEICEIELRDSVTDRIGLSYKFINNTKYYIELYINKNIHKFNHLNSWGYLNRLIDYYVK
jgi:hypothetical protein